MDGEGEGSLGAWMERGREAWVHGWRGGGKPGCMDGEGSLGAWMERGREARVDGWRGGGKPGCMERGREAWVDGWRGGGKPGCMERGTEASTSLQDLFIRAVVRHHLALTATSLGYLDRGGGKKTVLIS